MNSKICLVILYLAVLTLAGCSIAPEKPEAKAVQKAEVDEAIVVFKEKDPGIQGFFDKSAGYAVFPKVYKGAIWLGGAYGKGQVFEKDKLVGYSDLSQATLGFSFGGQYFREIIFFRDKSDFDKFKAEEYTFTAQAMAVAATAGAAAKTDYKDGLAVFVIAAKGLMVDASIGGQKFRFTPAMQ